MWLNPRFSFYARKNLSLVFPGDEIKQKELLPKSIESFAWLIVDTLRAPKLDKEWLLTHVKITGDGAEGYRNALHKVKGRGGFVLTGHLSSYELIAWIAPQVGVPMLALMRPFKNQYLNQWIVRLREQGGARVCSHKNSFFEMLRAIKKGETVGFLFDQNVTRNYALFVDWFGVPAATTKGLGFAAVSTKCPIVITTMRRVAFDSYEMDYEEVQTQDVYDRTDLDDHEKATEVTRRSVKVFEKCILRDPGSWFWLHRRWKTRPEGEPEDFYK
jgi:KDO2-lipid IV(A) lauroyltransferase